MSRTAATTELTAFDRLTAAVADRAPLLPLEPAEYAAGHALFEARSDQRSLLTDWLVRRVAPRSAGPTRVLSIGCGDGSVDVCIATALAAAGQRVEYVGVEPHRPSGDGFASRLAAVSGACASVVSTPFALAPLSGGFDLVIAVHSLYYVADLDAALRRAAALLAPGGELLVLHAPREPLNALTRLLAPGRRQEFSDVVAERMGSFGPAPEVVRIAARLDLTETGDGDADRRLVDFTVQARVPATLQATVRMALAERSLPGPGLVLPHPVDALVLPGCGP